MVVIEYEDKKYTFKEQDKFLFFICPIIRDILDSFEISDEVSASEIDDIGRDIWTDLPSYMFENEFNKMLMSYMKKYLYK